MTKSNRIIIENASPKFITPLQQFAIPRNIISFSKEIKRQQELNKEKKENEMIILLLTRTQPLGLIILPEDFSWAKSYSGTILVVSIFPER